MSRLVCLSSRLLDIDLNSGETLGCSPWRDGAQDREGGHEVLEALRAPVSVTTERRGEFRPCRETTLYPR